MSVQSARPLARPALLALACLSAACDGGRPADAAGPGDPTPPTLAAAPSDLGPELAALRRTTAPFQDLERAREAGYAERITPCWYHGELGGQGFHYGRTDWIDGSVSLLEPELLMYEPLPGGRLQLVAVEYIVPLDAWQDDAPPTLLGQDFHRNEALGLWVLHVWLWRSHPDDLFADWNPAVSCAHADEAEDRA